MRRPRWRSSPICARCRRGLTARNGAATSSPPCSAGWRAIQATLPKLEKPRNNSNGAATVELLKVLLRMTSERHAVASKVIATVDDLEADRGRRQRRCRRVAGLAARIVRRGRAVAEARQAARSASKKAAWSGSIGRVGYVPSHREERPARVEGLRLISPAMRLQHWRYAPRSWLRNSVDLTGHQTEPAPRHHFTSRPSVPWCDCRLARSLAS